MDIEEISRVIEKDRFAAHMGIEFTLIEEGRAVTRMELKEEHDNFMGMVHGGSIFAVADAAFSAASNSSGTKAVAVHIAIDYLAAPGDTPYPVSYTHLRAHETRHDLVCRLLLEK